MPRGGANQGGSMQTCFVMPMVSDAAAITMFGTWPVMAGQEGMCWELRTMASCEQHLAFEQNQWSQNWGLGNARAAAGYSDQTASTLLLAAPPFTVRMRKTAQEGLSMLQVNYAIVLWTDSDTIVLPPDTTDLNGQPIPFYIDPPRQPGLHRDLFRGHARKMLGRLLLAGFNFTHDMLTLAPPECAQQAAAAASQAIAAAAEENGMFIVHSILEERQSASRRKTEYLVQWAGYSPEWEVSYTRGQGPVGDPFLTWEPERNLRSTDALAAWKAAQPQSQ